jgi:universal stress protein F
MFKNILVPIDLNHLETASKPLSVAIKLCEIHGSKLHVVSVIPGFGMPLVAIHFSEDTLKKAKESVATTLSDFVEENIPKNLLVSQHVSTGQSYKEILIYCNKVGADLIIIQSHNPKGVEKVLLGSVTAKVVENSEISVLVIRA